MTEVGLPGFAHLGQPQQQVLVMPALVARIHVLLSRRKKGVDGRDKPGHDVDLDSFIVAAVLNSVGFVEFRSAGKNDVTTIVGITACVENIRTRLT